MRALFEYKHHFYIIDEEKNTIGPIEIDKITYQDGDIMCSDSDITGAINIKRVDKNDLYFAISSLNKYVIIYSDKISYQKTISPHSLGKQINDLCDLVYSNPDFSDVTKKIEKFNDLKDDMFDKTIDGTEYKCSEVCDIFEKISNMIKNITSSAPKSEKIFFCNILCEYTVFRNMLPNNIIPMTPFEMAEKLLDYIKNQCD